MHAYRNPAILPSFVAQHSIVLRPMDDVATLLNSTIALPSKLRDVSFKRRVEFLAGRHCAHKAIHQLAPRLPWQEIPINDAGLPLWPDGIVGSITHAGGFASAAVALDRDAISIGIDSEGLMTKDMASEIAWLVATQSELAETMAQTRLEENDALTLLFSAKEAAFKCLYPMTGLFFTFLEIEVLIAEAAPAGFTVHVPAAYSPRRPHTTQLNGVFELDESYCHTGIVLGV